MGQFIQLVLFGLLMFTIIWLAPETLFKLMQALFSHKITLIQFFQMILLDLPETLQDSMPMAVLFAAIFLFRRFSLSSELISFFNAGVSPKRLMVPVCLVGLLFAGLHLVIQEAVVPQTAPVYDQMRETAGLRDVKNRNFTFVEKNRANQWDKFLAIGQIQGFPDSLKHFMILYYDRDAQGGMYISRILTAASGVWDETHHRWHLFLFH